MLARPADKIFVGEVLRTLDGPLAPIACASRNFYRPCDDCTNQATCAVRLMMLEVREAMAGVLDRRTIADLRDLAANEMDAFVYHI
jgi:DNA-binding IscR family transcriptional regulator